MGRKLMQARREAKMQPGRACLSAGRRAPDQEGPATALAAAVIWGKHPDCKDDGTGSKARELTSTVFSRRVVALRAKEFSA